MLFLPGINRKMNIYTLLAIAVALSFDTFAVSLTFGVIQSRIKFFKALNVALIMALFQGGFPVAGYFLGSVIHKYASVMDHWVAFVLLAILGGRMVYEGIKGDAANISRDVTKPSIVLAMAIGTSIDAFAVGVSFAFIKTDIWISAAVIGAVTLVASMTAIRIGKLAGPKLGSGVEISGGIILIAIGVKILLEHTIFA